MAFTTSQKADVYSGCRGARDLERFAKRHHKDFGAVLNLELPKTPCDSTFLYLFERVELERLFQLLREWMLAEIAVQDRNVDELICDCLLVGFDGQEHVGPLLQAPLKNGRVVCRASAWISLPSRSIVLSSALSAARSLEAWVS